METIDTKELSIEQLVAGTQARVHKKKQIHFRTDEYFVELVNRAVRQRKLKDQSEFFERLAMEYFSRLGWTDYKPKLYIPQKVDLTYEKKKRVIFKGSQNGLRAYLKVFGTDQQKNAIIREDAI